MSPFMKYAGFLCLLLLMTATRVTAQDATEAATEVTGGAQTVPGGAGATSTKVALTTKGSGASRMAEDYIQIVLALGVGLMIVKKLNY